MDMIFSPTFKSLEMLKGIDEIMSNVEKEILDEADPFSVSYLKGLFQKKKINNHIFKDRHTQKTWFANYETFIKKLPSEIQYETNLD
jgi:hypothetical protein